MSPHRITMSSPYEARLPWRNYPGRLVSRCELLDLVAAAGSHEDEELEVVLGFAEAFVRLFDGEAAAALVAASVPPHGDALAMQPVPMVRTATGLYGVVQHDTIASLRSSLPSQGADELGQLLASWLLDSPGRLTTPPSREQPHR